MTNPSENGVWLLQSDNIAPFPYLYKSLDSIRVYLKKEFGEEDCRIVQFEELSNNNYERTFIIRYTSELVERPAFISVHKAFFCEIEQ